MAIEISMEASRTWNKRYLLELGENRPEMLLFYGHRVTKTVTETCLSQWYPCQFEVDGVTYTSANFLNHKVYKLLCIFIKSRFHNFVCCSLYWQPDQL